MSFARLLVASFILGCLSQFVAAEETSPTLDGTWSINFDIEEHFRGADNLPRIVQIEINHTGHYRTNYHLISDDPETSAIHSNEGTLEESQISHLKGWLDIIKNSDLPVNSDEIFKIGFGATLQPGWLGSLTLQQGESITKTQFNSLRSEDNQRPIVANQLVTFVFDLKRLALGKFDLNRKPAKNPDDA